MVSPFYPSPFPAGQEVGPRDQPVLSDPNPAPTPTDYFIPSSALNNPDPWTTQTPVSSFIFVSTPSSTAISTSVTLSTGTFQSTSTVVPFQGGSLSTGSSSNRKYVIGGAVGGGILVLIILALLLFCCRKRRGTKDPERSNGSHHEGQQGHDRFACCNPGAYDRNGGQSQMEQKTPLKPFILKSDPVASSTPKERPQEHKVSLNRRDSAESQRSTGSDTGTDILCSYDSDGAQRGTRRSQKRPPPLKLTSLVTPVISGPQNDPRRRGDLSSPPGLHEVPGIVVGPPPYVAPGRMRRH